MTSENVQTVRRLYDLFEDREVEVAFSDYLAPDFEISLPETYPEGGRVFRGREGFARWLAMIDDVWAEWRYESHRYREADDAVVALVRIVARSASGLPHEQDVAHVWRLEQGRATAVRVFHDQTEGLEAAGLRA
jgi:ketosteroid isomerase-like protein